MELELQYDSQESIPEGFAPLYTEKDGKWSLTGVKGLTQAMASNGNLTKALNAEREAHKATKTKLTEANSNVEKITTERDELQIKVESAGDKIDQTKIDELVERRVALVKGPLEKKIQEAQSQAKEWESKFNDAQGRERAGTKRAKIQEAATKAGVDKSMLSAAVQLVEASTDLDDAGNVIARDGGTFTPGLDLSSIFSTEAKQTYPGLWPVSQGGGARTPASQVDGKNNPYSYEHWSVTEQMRLDDADAQRMAKIAGVDFNNPKRPEPPKKP